ncbi:hypothetical protein HPB47_014060 [Ixodes persulcatus]|uniref:Uncharacterized protein n=1 Tax=Ixodes persulcatus TaxID=34615 RepID=A0AC60QXT4_IXOPE|nr:hypothetical protein HPB47_014060 [Ixodes persulcatus]
MSLHRWVLSTSEQVEDEAFGRRSKASGPGLRATVLRTVSAPWLEHGLTGVGNVTMHGVFAKPQWHCPAFLAAPIGGRAADARRTPPDAQLHRLEAWSAFPEQVLACRGNVSEAVAVLERALKLEPESKVIQLELGRLSAKKQREDRAEKAMYRRMFGAQGTPRPQTPRPAQRWCAPSGAKGHGGLCMQGRSWSWLAGGLVAVAALGVAAYRHVAAA